jgi:D-arabinose 1-dehydrogenase-like Zn-dependent alcohol dehydrogenase
MVSQLSTDWVIKLAIHRGAEVYAFTTSERKQKDILGFDAKKLLL